jgi:hypothetical protein
MKTETFLSRFRHLAPLLAVAFLLAGCDYDDDDYSHDPAPGKGALIVENRTGDDIAVYVDGARLEDADEDDDTAYDLSPGVRRVVLDQRGGDATFRGDVDIIEGRLTVMDVAFDSFDLDEFDVAIFFD